MKIVLAPDSFKGSLTAAEAAEAMAAGVRQVFPEAGLLRLPLADGGEGTVDALVGATEGRYESGMVTGPLGEPVRAAWGRLGPDGGVAAIEMAAAAGLGLVPPDRRDPRRTTTYGVGELIRRAAAPGVRKIIVGLGGSATNDGGAGALQALGVRFLDAAGDALPVPITGGDLARLAAVDAAGLWKPPAELVLASDVTSPLLGPSGASAVYGPQKGADPAIVAELEAALTNYTAVLRRDLGREVGAPPGGGAAGGLGAGLTAFLGARIESGIDLVLDTAQFEAQAAGADWLLTGEGRIDAQTLHGKALAGLLRRCRPLGLPVIAFGGSVDNEAAAALTAGGLQAAFSIVSGPMPLEEAVRNGSALLTSAVARVLRLVTTK